MSATITINPSEIRQIFQPRPYKPSQLWELAEKANSLAARVEEDWETISDEDKEFLKNFDATLETPKGLKGFFLAFLAFISRFYLAWLLLKGEKEAILAYFAATDRLLNAILEMRERQNIEYEKTLSQALEETFSNLESIKPMTAEDACDRLRKISYQAFDEL